MRPPAALFLLPPALLLLLPSCAATAAADVADRADLPPVEAETCEAATCGERAVEDDGDDAAQRGRGGRPHRHFVPSGKPRRFVGDYGDDDDDVDDGVRDEYKKNAEELRKKVALEVSAGQPTLQQIKFSRGCDRSPTNGRPLYTQEDWRRLRRIYKDQGGATIRYQEEPPAEFVPPLRPGHTFVGRGQGAFASRDIRQGQMVYAGVQTLAFFRDPASYRRFLGALTDVEACDVLAWSWTEETQWQKVIMMALDDHGLQRGSAGREANVGRRREQRHGPKMFNEYALRDIAEGEELVRYDWFSGNFWSDFGL